jgi:hypothetical protein
MRILCREKRGALICWGFLKALLFSFRDGSFVLHFLLFEKKKENRVFLSEGSSSYYYIIIHYYHRMVDQQLTA